MFWFTEIGPSLSNSSEIADQVCSLKIICSINLKYWDEKEGGGSFGFHCQWLRWWQTSGRMPWCTRRWDTHHHLFSSDLHQNWNKVFLKIVILVPFQCLHHHSHYYQPNHRHHGDHVRELYQLLRSPHIQQIMKTHDRIAQKEWVPTALFYFT